MADGGGIVLADAHVVFLDAVKTIIEQVGHRVIATASSRAELLDAVRYRRPRLCVSGDTFRDGDLLDVAPRLLLISPHTKVVCLTADADPDQLRRALEAGLVGYVHKARGISVLLEALRRVDAGEVVVDGSFTRSPYPDGGSADVRRLAAYLTQRERECLQLLVDGYGTPAMARRLGISSTTVRSHIQSVLTKLGAHSRLEAASLAVRHNLVDGAPCGRAVTTELRMVGSAI